MTAALLLALISAAILVQLVVAISVGVRQRGRHAVSQDTEADIARYIEPSAWAGLRDFVVSRRRYEDNDQTQCTFELKPVDAMALPPYKAGQFLTFALPAKTSPNTPDLDPAPVIRCYSLSDRADPSRYRITVKQVMAPPAHPEYPAGISSGWLHRQAKVGTALKLRAPSGRFVLDDDSTVPLVLIAGGIGITPLLSMLLSCLAEQPLRRVHLFYALRHGGVAAFVAALRQHALNASQLTLVLVYSEPRVADVLGRDFDVKGRVDIDLIKRTLPAGPHHFYVCGPPAMMTTLVPALIAWGVPSADVRFEAFGPASITPAARENTAMDPALCFEVQFAATARTVAWTGQDASLLDFAERNGIAIDAGCRVGNCGTCETRLLSGEVRYPHPPDFVPRAGYALLCLGKPVAALVLEA